MILPETPKPQKMKHNYTSELELKSLLIRIKNKQDDIGDTSLNRRITKYLKWHTALNLVKYEVPMKKKKAVVKANLKQKIIELSEMTQVDDYSYERFGKVILLMISKILTKSNFSSYTYHDEFYSDAINKILKYLHNFNHKMISERTGQPGNAFAYISQIIHNSVIYVINTKKKEYENYQKLKAIEEANHEFGMMNHDVYVDTHYEAEQMMVVKEVVIETITGSLFDEINKHKHLLPVVDQLNIFIPKKYIITFEDYSEMKELLKGKVSIMRSK